MIAAGNNKILIVDDEPLNRLFLVELLKMQSLEPTEAENGNEAISHWLANDYIAILMDIQMPEMTGTEATRFIRRKEREEGRSKTPIIAVTAYCTTENQEKCQKAGMDHYLPKPVNIPELLDLIHRCR